MYSKEFYEKISEYESYLDKIKKSKNKITLFYGTKDLDLEVNYPIDPIYCKKNETPPSVFEFGLGFYLTPHLDIALGYTYGNLIDIADDMEIEFPDLINGYNDFHIHSYEIDLSSSEINLDSCLLPEEFKQELYNTIKGYKQNKYYNKDKDITIGLMCGTFWDIENSSYDKFEKNPKLQGDNNINNFIENCMNSVHMIKNNSGKLDIPVQYCLHKNKNLLSNHIYGKFSTTQIIDITMDIMSEMVLERILKKSGYEDIEEKVFKDILGCILSKINKKGVEMHDKPRR